MSKPTKYSIIPQMGNYWLTDGYTILMPVAPYRLFFRWYARVPSEKPLCTECVAGGNLFYCLFFPECLPTLAQNRVWQRVTVIKALKEQED